MSDLQKITEAQMNEKGVCAAPDILNGSPSDNKAIFDRMVRQLVAPAYNAAVDAVNAINHQEISIGEAEAARAAAEQGRVYAESGRVTEEQDRRIAEAARAAAEKVRTAAEDGRTAAETARAGEELSRASAEASREMAEATRLAAETAREAAEAARADETAGIVARAAVQAEAASAARDRAETAGTAAAGSAEQAALDALETAQHAGRAADAEEAAGQAASTASAAAEAASASAFAAAAGADKAERAQTAAQGAETGARQAAASAAEADAAAQGARSAAEAAGTAAALERMAIENMGVEAETLSPGAAATVEKRVAEDGTVTLAYGIPQGQKGDTGMGLKIKGHQISLAALQQAVTDPSQGDAYSVGAATPYDIYIWDGEGWVNNGPLQGAKGDPGKDGAPGRDGQSPYQVAVGGGYSGTEETFNRQLSAVGDMKKPTAASVTLRADGWNAVERTQSVAVSGVLADPNRQAIFPSPVPDSVKAAGAAGVYCSGQAADALSFTCAALPAADLSYQILIQEVEQ